MIDAMSELFSDGAFRRFVECEDPGERVLRAQACASREKYERQLNAVTVACIKAGLLFAPPREAIDGPARAVTGAQAQAMTSAIATASAAGDDPETELRAFIVTLERAGWILVDSRTFGRRVLPARGAAAAAGSWLERVRVSRFDRLGLAIVCALLLASIACALFTMQVATTSYAAGYRAGEAAQQLHPGGTR